MWALVRTLPMWKLDQFMKGSLELTCSGFQLQIYIQILSCYRIVSRSFMRTTDMIGAIYMKFGGIFKSVIIICFVKIPMRENSIADTLVKKTVKSRVLVIWWNTLPPFRN